MEQPAEVRTGERKPYEKPQIVHELELETRAGSVITGPNIPDL